MPVVFCTPVINTMLVMSLSAVRNIKHLSPKMGELLNHLGRRGAMADIFICVATGEGEDSIGLLRKSDTLMQYVQIKFNRMLIPRAINIMGTTYYE